MNTFQISVVLYDYDGNVLSHTIQEIPDDGEYHWSEIVKVIK